MWRSIRAPVSPQLCNMLLELFVVALLMSSESVRCTTPTTLTAFSDNSNQTLSNNATISNPNVTDSGIENTNSTTVEDSLSVTEFPLPVTVPGDFNHISSANETISSLQGGLHTTETSIEIKNNTENGSLPVTESPLPATVAGDFNHTSSVNETITSHESGLHTTETSIEIQNNTVSGSLPVTQSPLPASGSGNSNHTSSTISSLEGGLHTTETPIEIKNGSVPVPQSPPPVTVSGDFNETIFLPVTSSPRPFAPNDSVPLTYSTSPPTTVNHTASSTSYLGPDNVTTEMSTLVPTPGESHKESWATRLSLDVARYILTDAYDQQRIDEIIQDSQYFFNSAGLSLACKTHLKMMMEKVSAGVRLQLNPSKLWAFQMIDANAKSLSGNLKGRTFWLGNFDQCLAINVQVDDHVQHGESFVGKYCLSRVEIPLFKSSEIPVQLDKFDSTLKVASCLPSTCTPGDVKILLKEFNRPVFDTSSMITTDHMCQTQKDSYVDASSVIISIILAVFAAFLVLSTVYDLVDLLLINRANRYSCGFNAFDDTKRYNPESCTKRKWLLLLFSFRKSALFKLSSRRVDESYIPCIYGLRFLNILWLIALQTFAFALREYPWFNQGDVFSAKDKILAPLVSSATHATDTYLFLSSFCVTLIVLEILTREDRVFKIIPLAVARYLRITAPYAAVVAFMSGPMAWLSGGPLWPVVIDQRDKCRSSWWANLLYVNNFAQSYEEQCLRSTWYLSLDMQCYIISLPLIFFLFKKPQIARNVLLILTMISSVTVGLLIGQFDLEQYFGGKFTSENFSQYFSKMLSVPWTRIGVSFMGIIVAHYTQRAREHGFKMKPHTYISGWIVSKLILLCLIYGTLPFSGEHRMHRATEVFYGVVSRPLFGAVVGWTIFACATGYGGIFNTFLSLPAFRWLGRLSFCMFLVHEPVLMYYFWSAKSEAYIGMANMAFLCLGTFAVIILAAMFLYVMIDSPFGDVRRLSFVEYAKNQIPKMEQPPEEVNLSTTTYQTFPRPSRNLISENTAFGIAASTDDDDDEVSVANVESEHQRTEMSPFNGRPGP